MDLKKIKKGFKFNITPLNFKGFGIGKGLGIGKGFGIGKGLGIEKGLGFKRKSPNASPQKQKQWKSMGIPQRSVNRILRRDSDGDGTPNRFDCRPHNRLRQDSNVRDLSLQEAKSLCQSWLNNEKKNMGINMTKEEEDSFNVNYYRSSKGKTKIGTPMYTFYSPNAPLGGDEIYVWLDDKGAGHVAHLDTLDYELTGNIIN